MAYKFQLGDFSASGSITAQTGFDANNADIDNVDSGSFGEVSASGMILAAEVNFDDVSNIAGNVLTDNNGALDVNLAAGGGLEEAAGALEIKLSGSDSGLSRNADGLKIDLSGSSLTRDGGGIKINNLGVTNDMLAGSIADSKLNNISTANKVQGSAVQLRASAPGIQDNTGLEIKLSGSASGLNKTDDGVFVDLSGSASGLEISPDGLFLDINEGTMEIGPSGLDITNGGVTNDMLSGSIANAKLANQNVTLTAGAGMAAIGSVNLGASVTVAVDGVLEDLDTLGAAASDGQFIVATGAGAFQYESGTTVRDSLGLGTGDNVQFTDLTLTGDLTVQGSTTTISTTNLEVEDKNILIASGAASTAAARGAGLTVDFADVQWKYSDAGEGDASGSGDIWIASGSAGLVDIQAAEFYGDGSNLTGVTADGVAYSVVSKADGNTLEIDKYNYFADLSSNATVTLPASNANLVGKSIFVKAADLTSGATIIINTAAAAQKVDGQDTIILESGYAAVRLVYVATDDWRVF